MSQMGHFRPIRRRPAMSDYPRQRTSRPPALTSTCPRACLPLLAGKALGCRPEPQRKTRIDPLGERGVCVPPDRQRRFQRMGAFFRQPDRAAAQILAGDGDFDQARRFQSAQISRQRRLIEAGALRERAERVVGRGAICAIKPNWLRLSPPPCMCSSRKFVIRRAASRLAQPAHAATAACASRTSVLPGTCGCFAMVVCIYIICIYKEIAQRK